MLRTKRVSNKLAFYVPQGCGAQSTILNIQGSDSARKLHRLKHVCEKNLHM